MEVVLGIIGGSGLYHIDGLENIESRELTSPWGKPSAALVFGKLNNVKVIFLARHGKGHTLAPNEINYRANIDVLKRAGVTDILSISACGSLKAEFKPGDFVLVDQFIDRTIAREKSFFGEGLVAHVAMAKPTCQRLAKFIKQESKNIQLTMHEGGTYLAMEGPQFSTYAESILYKSWGCDVIGMTNMPEAKLAREAEMCYQTIAMVTDFDCWHSEHAAVDVKTIIHTLNKNIDHAKTLIHALTYKLQTERTICNNGCDRALEHALITAAEFRDPIRSGKLDAVAGRILT